MIDTTVLERVREVLEPQERDHYGILRFRTPSEVIARGVMGMMKEAGYGAVLLAPKDTWHKQWSVSCWGDYTLTAEGAVPTSSL